MVWWSTWSRPVIKCTATWVCLYRGRCVLYGGRLIKCPITFISRYPSYIIPEVRGSTLYMKVDFVLRYGRPRNSVLILLCYAYTAWRSNSALTQVNVTVLCKSQKVFFTNLHNERVNRFNFSHIESWDKPTQLIENV